MFFFSVHVFLLKFRSERSDKESEKFDVFGVAPDEAEKYVMTMVMGTNCFTGAHGDVLLFLIVVCQRRMVRG